MILVSITKWFTFILLALFSLIAFSNTITPKQPKEPFEKEKNWSFRFFTAIVFLIIFLVTIA